MIHNLKPYPALKNSGVPWLGEVPVHWEILPNRAILTEIRERDRPDEQMLSVTITKGVIRQQTLLAGTSKKDSSNQDKSAYKLVSPGDIVYNKMRAWQGAIGVSDYLGIVSPAYVVQRPRGGMDSRYIHHLLRTPAFAKEAERWSYGITSDMWSLRPEHFRMIYVCIPPLPEQAAIVRFLDYADRRIRRFIRTKQKLIKLLEEQKQAVIHHAVTRGLDPNVRLKPSGVEWLGEVPEHWEVLTLRYLATKFGSGVTPKGGAQVYQTEGVPFLRSQNVHFGGLRMDGVAKISRGIHNSMSTSHVHPFDVLLNITGASIGRVCYVPSDFVEGNVNQHVCIIRPKRTRISPQYLAAFLSTPGIQTEIYLSQNGSSREGLTLQSIRDLPVLIPPLAEQEVINGWVSDRTNEIDAAVIRLNREISLLREYRTRLIADVVTGKLDVREAAARLPEEVDEADLLDETEIVTDGEEELEVAAEEIDL